MKQGGDLIVPFFLPKRNGFKLECLIQLFYNYGKEVRKMEKQILEILLDLRGEMKEVRTDMKEFRSELKTTQADIRSIRSDLKETQADVRNIRSDLKTTQADVKDIKETVNRIEISQTEDVIAMLKVTKQHTESEFHYLNTRLTDIDKRVFNLENRVER
jgi:chromosome segregation ATPase